MPTPLTFDVSDAIGSGEQLTQTAWAFLPEHPTEAPAILVCLAGGLYDKHYWHMEIDGHPGYSFGEHIADAGYIVIAVDHLAVGESTDPVDSGPLGLELLAIGDAEVVRQIRAMSAEGSLIDGLPPMTLPVVGVGHSMGSCLTTMVQARDRVYDAVALLGYGVQITNVYAHDADANDLEARIRQNIAIACEFSGARPEDSHTIAPRSNLIDMFYGGEVPLEVIDADTAVQSRVPLRAAAEVTTPGFVEHYTPEIEVPVFLAFGAAIDVSPNPYGEPVNYTGSSDVTLYLVPKAGHCHNFGSHRAALWDRIAAWVPTVV
ncbi:alpha/beta hydrolase [Mycobacterium sp. E796]|uniref:alpha/beta hydrolase n=1 Tax=Mycobacterium sp. E796 TaxID=1834151 RepID=UPI0008011165|nr:alpha/beta hydrolase [Mycobacterium sp. E796]OBI44826.1 alpha/beta hydrolase [Mycobacterium sp. E796]